MSITTTRLQPQRHEVLARPVVVAPAAHRSGRWSNANRRLSVNSLTISLKDNHKQKSPENQGFFFQRRRIKIFGR
jgi:hypothetical protein